jgi:DNA ligase-1
MTHMFPEVVESTKKLKAKSLILDSEVLSYNEKTGEFYPFQVTAQRKRKHGIKEKAGELPIKVFCFDMLYKDGKELTDLPLKKRLEMLNKVIPKKDRVLTIAESIMTGNPKKLDKYFEDAISRGLEGIVAKDLKAPYMIGERKFSWIKLKRSYKGELSDTVDVVIVGFYTGSGHRAEFGFGGFLGAVYDQREDMFKTIARVGSGFSEDNMKKMKQMLSEIKTGHKPARVDSTIEPDFWVSPKYVATVRADEITESTMHTAGKRGKGTGYALRFPRMVGWIREDRRPEDATTVSEIVKMFKEQRRSKLGG